MRILHIVHSLVPGEYRGGISKVAHELAAAQARLGHEVEVYATTLNSGVATDIPAGHIAEFDRLRCTYFAADPRAGSRSRSPSLQRRLLQTAAEFDVLHGHNPCTHLSRYLAHAGRRSGTPVFHHLHGALNPYGQQSWYRYLRRFCYVRLVERSCLRGNAALFCLSRHEATHAERQLQSQNTVVLPNGIALPTVSAEFAKAERDAFRHRHQLQEKRVLLFLGRICDLKGVHLLADAFGALAAEDPTLHLVIAGNREQFPDYVAQVDAVLAARHVAQRTTWTGFLSDEQKQQALRGADIFCHPSETEGMPMAVLEAMAAGLPSVIGRGCFMEQAARAGAVVECDFDAGSVRAALSRCLKSHGLRRRLSLQAVAHIRRHHRWDAIAEQTLDAYASAWLHARSKSSARRAA